MEVCAEVAEQVERLVRHTHVRNEDGSFRQLFRVVIGIGCVQSISCCQGCQLAKWRRKIVSVWSSKGEHVEVFKVASLISSVLLLVQLRTVSFLWVIRTVLWTTMLPWCLCLNLV